MKLVYQSYSTSFLIHIHNHTFTFFLNHLHRFMKLWAAVTSARSTYISRHSSAMDAQRSGVIFLPFPVNEGEMLLSCIFLRECFQSTVAPLCCHAIGFLFLDQRIVIQPVFK